MSHLVRYPLQICAAIALGLVLSSSAVRADILIESFNQPNFDPELAISFANPSNTITPGATNWSIDLTTSTQSDYFGYARSIIAPEGFFDITTETSLQFDFSISQAGSYGTEVFVVLEDFFGGVSVYKSAFGAGNHVYTATLSSPTFTAGSGPADLADLSAIQIQANSFAPPPGGGPGAVSAPYKITMNELRAASPVAPHPSIVTNFNNTGVFTPGYAGWGSATFTPDSNSLRVAASGFGGAVGQAFGTLEAEGSTHVELNVTVNDTDSPLNFIALLQDADGTQNVYRWYGINADNGENGTNNHVLSFRSETVTTAGFIDTPVLIDNANSWQAVPTDTTPGNLLDNTTLDLANLTFFHIQVEPQGGVGSDSYDVSFNNLRVMDAPGNFDTDYDVDGRDFLTWQRGLTPTPLSSANLAEWQAGYDASLTAIAAVPEPAAITLLLACAIMSGLVRQDQPR